MTFFRFSFIGFCLLFQMSAFGQNLSLDWRYDGINGDGTFFFATSHTVDKWGNVIIVGQYENRLFLEIAPGVDTMTNCGSREHTFIVKLDKNGNYVWSHAYSGFYDNKAEVIRTDSAGNIYIGGAFARTIDLDPGAGVDTFTATSSSSQYAGYITSFDPNGNYRFSSVFNGGSYATVKFLEIRDGYLYCSGEASPDTDLDPDPNDTLTVQGGNYLHYQYVSKFDLQGNLIWAKRVNTNNGNFPYGISIGPDNHVYFYSRIVDTIDVDPGPGTHFLYQINQTGAYVLKLDSMGEYVWVYPMLGTKAIQPWRLVTDNQGNIYACGSFLGTVDFDNGPGVQNRTAHTNGSFFLLKLDENSGFQWVNIYDRANTCFRLSVDEKDHVYMTLHCSPETDLDPGPGYMGLDTLNGLLDVGMRIAPTGELVWAAMIKRMAANAGIVPTDSSLIMVFNAYNNSVLRLDSTDHLFTPTFNSQVAVIKVKQDLCASFIPVIDSAKDVSCASTGFASATAINGIIPLSYNWSSSSTDSGIVVTNSGIYRVTVADVAGCQKVRGVLINGPAQQDVDLQVLAVLPSFRPGFRSTINLNVINTGCDLASDQVRFVLDSDVQFTGANPTPDLVSGDTLFWSFTDLNYESGAVSFDISVIPDVLLNPGDSLCFSADVGYPAGETDTTNNTWSNCGEVTNAYDPNDKQVYPAGVCDANYVLKIEPLTYTVRFQNTGNADAINIFILDTLNVALDPNSLRIKSASHDLTMTEVIDSNIIKFRFDGIHLPDSNSNEPASNGYIMFEVWPKASALHGTVVQNRAGIYFDHNSVVLTNTLTNTLVDTLPEINTAILITGDSLVSFTTGGSYQWVSCDNNFDPIPGQTGQVFQPSDSGYYAVHINYLSCHAYSECVFFNLLTTGFAEKDLHASIYPNPTKGIVTVHLGTVQSQVNVSVTDIMGKQIAKTVAYNTSNLDVPIDAPRGIYILSIVDASGETLRFKVIKD